MSIPAGGNYTDGSVITATDMSGQKVATIIPVQGTNSIAVSTSAWSSGLYIFTVQFGNGRYATAKVVIAKQ